MLQTAQDHVPPPIPAYQCLNGERRHLTASQRGAIARKMLPELREEAKKRKTGRPPKDGKKSGSKDTDFSDQGRATEKAAEKVGVSNATVNRAGETLCLQRYGVFWPRHR